MFEHRKQPVLPRKLFYQRLLGHLVIAGGILSLCLLIGIAGYHYIAHAAWIDAFHNAAMILSGMGPVIEIRSFGGKVFSALYALFSGVVFITNIGVLLAPVIHRLLHRLHLDHH